MTEEPMSQMEEILAFMAPGEFYRVSVLAEETLIDAQQVRKCLRVLAGKKLVTARIAHAYREREWRRVS